MRRLLTRFLFTASFPRVVVETLLLFAVLTVFVVSVFGSQAELLYPSSLLFFINPLCALWYAVRRCPVQGGRLRQLMLETASLLAVYGLLVAMLPPLFNLLNIQPYPGDTPSMGFLVFMAAVIAFPFFYFRFGARLLAWWAGMRRRRLLWSLVHSHLVAAAVLQAIVIVPVLLVFALSETPYRVTDLPANPLTDIMTRLQLVLPLLGVTILAASVLLVALLPVSAAVSYVYARRLRQRLGTLMQAARAAGDGNYEARIVPQGSDEITLLQTDFNAMIAKLDASVQELRKERETVQSLLNARRELVANVSHDLRTPVATVRAYLESALRTQNGMNGAMTPADIEIVQAEVLRLQGLIDDLFTLSRAEVDALTFHCAPVDAAALIERVVGTVAPLAWQSNRVEVIASAPRWLPPMHADETRVEQALRNLLHNSLRHTPPGGIVNVGARVEKSVLHIDVRDTGEGIAPDVLPHLWERYYRGDDSGGAGLGLALVKSFTEGMGGHVAVASTPGEGACFTIALPLAHSHEPSTLPHPNPVPRP